MPETITINNIKNTDTVVVFRPYGQRQRWDGLTTRVESYWGSCYEHEHARLLRLVITLPEGCDGYHWPAPGGAGGRMGGHMCPFDTITASRPDGSLHPANWPWPESRLYDRGGAARESAERLVIWG